MIGTLTFHWGTNYGAVIQAYALQQFLIKNGYKTEIINYVPLRLSVLRFIFALKHKDTAFLKKELKLRHFRKHKLICSSSRYRNNKSLHDAENRYSTVIVGSDQVWNYSFTMGAENKITLSYFLDFCGKDTKKIAYAVSFGQDEMPQDYIETVGSYMRQFDAISVRETTACNIVAAANCVSDVVCDPSILLERADYNALIASEMTEKIKIGSYIYTYMLHNQNNSECVEKILKNCYLLPVINSADEDIIMWLNYIKNAKFVITNSFHGMVFSTIFNTPFVVLPVLGSKMNARIETFLAQVGLKDRFVENVSNNQLEFLTKSEIDWDSVNKNLEKMRKQGSDFIIGNLLK